MANRANLVSTVGDTADEPEMLLWRIAFITEVHG